MANPLELELKFYSAVREEILFRIRHRDHWLKLQLYLQVILLAVAAGFRFAGVESLEPKPWVLAFATVLALVFLALYRIEDNLIGLLSRHAGGFGHYQPHEWVSNWDASTALQMYPRQGLPYRLVAQAAAFIGVPMVCVVYRLLHYTEGDFIYPEVVLHVVILAAVAWIIRAMYKDRKGTGAKGAHPDGKEK